MAFFTETVNRVDQRTRSLLQEWQDRRGLSSRGAANLTNVRLLEGVSRVSCLDYSGITNLVERISEQGTASIQVPPAWELTLKVIDALREHRLPLSVAREHLRLPNAMTADVVRVSTEPHTVMTKSELFTVWRGIVHHIRSEVQVRGQTAVVSNWESALDGALWIR